MDVFINYEEEEDNYLEAKEAIKHAGEVNYTRKFTIHDYTLRVSGKTKLEILQSIQEMKDVCDGVELYAVGFEEGHCHMVFEPWAKGKAFRTSVKTIFNIEKATNYSLSKVRDNPLKALSYILKDGDYNVGCHVDKDQLELALKLCFGKGRLSFKKKHEELIEKLARTGNRKKYYINYTELKIHHNQKIYWHHIKAHCAQVFMKMDPFYKNDLIQRQWEDSGLMTREEWDRINDRE